MSLAHSLHHRHPSGRNLIQPGVGYLNLCHQSLHLMNGNSHLQKGGNHRDFIVNVKENIAD